MTRFFINIGRKDKLNPAKLIGLINDQEIGEKVEIGAIDILETFSFFELDNNFEQKTLKAFTNNEPDFNGRIVNVEITKKDKSSGGGARRRRNKPFGKKESGFGRRRSESKGNKRNQRSSDNSKNTRGFGRRRR